VNRFLCWIVAVWLLAVTAAGAVAKNPVVAIETSMGTIKVELFEDKAPITVKNFLSYVDKKFYDGTVFHRVMPGFMIQGGGFEPGMKEKKTDSPIKNEAENGVSNARGTIAMARTPVPDSATAQFFINLKDNMFLDHGANPRDPAGYCVFGKMVEGMNVVDQIKDVATETRRITDARTGRPAVHQYVPKEDVVIKSIRRAD
jgi:peptidyl-prolyl cis-trans isomerase B (cyclophilin B)